MYNDTTHNFKNQKETRTFPSYNVRNILYGSKLYNDLINAKALLSTYGYKRHDFYFDIVVKNNLCFNITFNENGIYTTKLNKENNREIH